MRFAVSKIISDSSKFVISNMRLFFRLAVRAHEEELYITWSFA
jgi:hypothetical protein